MTVLQTADTFTRKNRPSNRIRSSPTPRAAAYHSDIELVGRSQAFVEVMKQVDLVANINLACPAHRRAGNTAKNW